MSVFLKRENMQIAPQHITETQSVVSQLECSMACYQRIWCIGFEYIESSKSCKLSNDLSEVECNQGVDLYVLNSKK